MIQVGTNLQVADNSGAKRVECIKILGGTRKRYAYIGDIIVISVKDALPETKVKKGQVAKALIVRTKKEIRRNDGSYLRFDDNAVVMVDDASEPIGTRVLGPVARELRGRGYMKVLSMAPEVL